MAPARNRTSDDPRLDTTSSTKDKTMTSGSKARRHPASSLAAPSTNKSAAASSAAASAHPGETVGMSWPRESVDTIHKYRSANRIEIPLSFQSDYNAAVLTTPGIGAQSPTMARKKDKRKVTKEQAALAVRKHFNNQAINESEVVVEFLYKVKMKDQAFKLHFSPQGPR